MALAATDETFDGATVEDTGTKSYTLNGMIYTNNDLDSGTYIKIVDDGDLASGSDHALMFNSSGFYQCTLDTIKTADGTEFKLNSFVISNFGDETMTISGYRDNVMVATTLFTVPLEAPFYKTFDVSADSDWENIDEIRISSADLAIEMDDLDVSPAVLPTYSITYHANSATSGSVPTDGATYHYNDTATAATNSGSLERTGYTYNGWNTASDGSGTHYDESASITITGDVTLYAEWTAINYTVTYDGNGSTGGSAPTDGNTYNITDTVTVLGAGTLVKPGYTLSEWDTESDGSGTGYSSSDTFSMGSSDVTLYAQWTQDNYSITYHANSATTGSVPNDATTYLYNDTATTRTNYGSLGRTGYIYNGWNTASDGSGTHYDESASITMTGDVTLYAEWTAIDYTVTYDGNGSTGGSEPTDGNTYNITDTVTVVGTGTLVKTGYMFSEWNTASNGSGTGYSPSDTFSMGSSDVTLYAQWTQDNYSITYHANSATTGSVPNDATTYLYNDTATVAANSGSLERTGYTYNGWNTASDGSGTHYDESASITITGDVTLYAEWTAINYTVTYDGNGSTGGSAPTDGNTYNITDTVTVLGTGTLVKQGYTFSEWNTALDGSGTGYSPSDTFSMGSSNVTLYAQWTQDNYSITYHANSATSGSVPTDGATYHYNDAATVAANSGSLERTGYTYNGWNTATDGSGTHYDASASITMTGNITLYAEWTAIDYTVTYDGNGSTGGSEPTDGNTYNITDTVTVVGTETLVKLGYTFSEWNTASDGSGTGYSPSDTFSMGSSDVTLYAQWTQDNYSITYHANSATSGSVPTDGATYHYNDAATAAANSGSLERTGYTYNGWNTATDGSGNPL